MKLPSAFAAVALAAILAAQVATAEAANAPTLAPPGAPFDIDRALGNEAPDEEQSWKEVWSAWILFGPTLGEHPQRATFHLQYLMLQTTTDVIEALGRKLDEQDWNPRFKALFADARAWRKKLAAMSMDQVYEVRNSLYRLAEGTDKKEPKRHYGSLAFNLNHLLLNLNHVPTRYDFAVKLFNRNTLLGRHDGFAWIRVLATEGDYAPAQVFGTKIYLREYEGRKGPAAELAFKAAYYWLKRAARTMAVPEGLMARVKAQLDGRQIAEVEGWLKERAAEP